MSEQKSSTIEPGTIVYDREGRQYSYVAACPTGGHFTRAIVCGDEWDNDADEWLEAPVLREHVYIVEPRALVSEDVSELRRHAERLQTEIDALYDQKAAAQGEVRSLGQEMERLAQLSPVVRRLADFLDGRVTHVVLVNWTTIEVMPLDDALKPDDRSDWHRKERKLVSLFGKSKGDLQWRVNRYRDGSGSWRDVYPCTSEEEAISKRAEVYAAKFADAEKPHAWSSLVSQADALGIDVPVDVRAKVDADALAAATKKAEKARRELDRAKAELAALAAPQVASS